MNRSSKKAFLDLLAILGEEWRQELALNEGAGALRKAYLAYGSETPDNLKLVEHIGYGRGVKSARQTQGLMIGGTNIFVSELLCEVANSPMPPGVQDAFPEMTQEKWWSVMQLAFMVCSAFEYDEQDNPVLMEEWKKSFSNLK